jgi:2-(1,2-epoxy-1,2-dihydrophenyl)acetyl-CoA isomerase
MGDEFDVIRRAWAAQSRKDEDAFRAELHPAIEVMPFGTEIERESYSGPDEVIGWWHRDVLANWEDFETIPEDFRSVGDRILVTGRWRARGKRSGVLLERPASWIIEVRDGKIASWRTYTDRAEALREIDG